MYGKEKASYMNSKKTGARKKEYTLYRFGVEFYRGDRLGACSILQNLGYPKDNPIYQKKRLEKDGITICIQHMPH